MILLWAIGVGLALREVIGHRLIGSWSMAIAMILFSYAAIMDKHIADSLGYGNAALIFLIPVVAMFYWERFSAVSGAIVGILIYQQMLSIYLDDLNNVIKLRGGTEFSNVGGIAHTAIIGTVAYTIYFLALRIRKVIQKRILNRGC